MSMSTQSCKREPQGSKPELEKVPTKPSQSTISTHRTLKRIESKRKKYCGEIFVNVLNRQLIGKTTQSLLTTLIGFLWYLRTGC